MKTITKVVRPGAVARLNMFVTIKWDGKRLSITGALGPRRSGNAASFGQNRDDLRAVDAFAPGWDAEMRDRLADIWDRWHLNDMRAGTPAQMKIVRATPGGYDEHRAALKTAGIYEDGGYRYGSAWLTEEVPADVIEWLMALPESDIAHPWGD